MSELPSSQEALQGPFSQPLVDAGFLTGKEIGFVPSNPEIIVREVIPLPIRWLERYDSRFERVIMRQYAELLGELATEYAMPNPGLQFIVAEHPDESTWLHYDKGYAITRRVHGVSMEENMSQVPEEITLRTMQQIIQYYDDVSNKGESWDYIPDLSLRQFMYGSVQYRPLLNKAVMSDDSLELKTRREKEQQDSETDPKPYFVDLDRNVMTYYESDPDSFDLWLRALFRGLKMMEDVYKRPMLEPLGALVALRKRVFRRARSHQTYRETH